MWAYCLTCLLRGPRTFSSRLVYICSTTSGASFYLNCPAFKPQLMKTAVLLSKHSTSAAQTRLFAALMVTTTTPRPLFRDRGKIWWDGSVLPAAWQIVRGSLSGDGGTLSFFSLQKFPRADSSSQQHRTAVLFTPLLSSPFSLSLSLVASQVCVCQQNTVNLCGGSTRARYAVKQAPTAHYYS